MTGWAGDDHLAGSTYAETLWGGAGADVIDAGPEVTVADTFGGGPGVDTIRYAAAPKAVHVDLPQQQADPRDGVGTGDELFEFETVVGSSFADRIVGTPSANAIDAGPGADEIAAGAGDDTVQVRDGEHDSADCGADADTAVADRRDTDALVNCESADFLPDPPQPPPPGTDSSPVTPDTTLALSLRARRVQRLLRTRALRATVSCAGEPCTVRADGKLGRIELRRVTRTLAADTPTRVKVPLSRRAIRRVRTLLTLHRKPRLRLRVEVQDAAGNAVIRTRAIRALPMSI